MDNKKGFNLFGTKNNELPNQNIGTQNNEVEQRNFVQPEYTQPENTNIDFTVNNFSEQPSMIEMPAVTNNFEQNNFDNSSAFSKDTQQSTGVEIGFQSAQTPQLTEANTFEMNSGSDFSMQDTEQSIENQLASMPAPTQNTLPTQESTPIMAQQQTPQQEVPQLPPEPKNINTLNNLGTYDGNMKVQAKKELNKKPFIIIAAVLVLFICISLVSKGPSQIFGKAPNDIVIPGEKDDDLSNKVEAPEEDETDENDENDEYDENGNYIGGDGNDIVLDPNQPQEDNEESNTELPSSGGEALNGENIKDTISRYEHTQVTIDTMFDTLAENPSYIVLPNNQDVIYEVNQVGYDFKILRDGNVVSYLNMAPEDGEAIDGVVIYATGHLSNKYILIKVHKNYDYGDFYILDSQFQIITSGKYEKEYEPTITLDAIYFGKVNCNGIRSNKKSGPVVEIYKFNTQKGTSEHRYSIDYANNYNKCS